MKRLLISMVLATFLCSIPCLALDFAFERSNAFAAQPSSDLDVADLDGDGDLDVLLMQAIMFNDGAGVFTARPRPYSTPLFRLADVDGDGDPDIVGVRDSDLYIQLNDGAANFTALPFQRGNRFNSMNAEIALADLTGDGAVDVVTNSGALFVNQGGGLFTEQGSQRGLGAQFMGTDVAVLDANRDGRMDLFFPFATSRGYVLFIQQPQGTFVDETSSRVLGVGNVSFYDGLDALDLNGDGATDIVSNSQQGMKVLMNDGTGVFHLVTDLFDCYCSPAYYPAAWAVRDLNMDGAQDLLMLDSSLSRIYYGGPGGRFIASSRQPFTLPNATTTFSTVIHFVDLNGDGTDDLLFRRSSLGSAQQVNYFVNRMFPQASSVRQALTGDLRPALETTYLPPSEVGLATYSWALYRGEEAAPSYHLSGSLIPLDGSATTSPAGAKVVPGYYRASLLVTDSYGRTIATGGLQFTVAQDFFDAYQACGEERLALQAELAASQAAQAVLAEQLAGCSGERAALLLDAALTQAGLAEIRRLAALPPGHRQSTFQPQGSQAARLSEILGLLLPGGR